MKITQRQKTVHNQIVLYVLAVVVDLFCNDEEYVRKPTGVQCGDLTMTYSSIYQDVLAATDNVHAKNGPLKCETMKNVEKYVIKDSRLPILLDRMRRHGSKVFLVTNSDYVYTNTVMNYLMDFPSTDQPLRDWVSYFDYVVVDARKPLFFGAGTILRQVDRILVGLRYFAKRDFLSEVADLHGISKATAARLLDNFVDAVNRRVNTIRFPTSREQLERMKLGFYQRAGIPEVVGAIDGTLVPIIAPTVNEEAYVCRNGFHAVNIQAVVGFDMRFTDVVAKWPGSQHDAAILNMCGLKDYLETHNIGHLIGDSGYPLRPYSLTPVIHPNSEAERTFNSKHCKTRVVVEKAFGLLKSRFRCLHRSGGCLPFQSAKCCKVVMACMRLHNLCIDNNVPIPEMCLQNNELCNDEVVEADERGSGQTTRQGIINTFN